MKTINATVYTLSLALFALLSARSAHPAAPSSIEDGEWLTSVVAPYFKKNITPLIDAVADDDLAKVQELIKKKATRKDLSEALIQALVTIVPSAVAPIIVQMKNSLPILQALLAAGADANTKDSNGTPALLLVAGLSGSLPLVEVLLRAKADPRIKDNDGTTALMVAAGFADNLPTIKALLAAGADVNAKNNNGETALSLLEGIEPVGTTMEALKAALRKAGAK